VEVEIKSTCTLKAHQVASLITERLQEGCPVFRNGPIYLDETDDICESIMVCDLEREISSWQAQLCIHAFRMSDQEPEKDFIEGEDELPACEQWELPNRHLCGLWDSIVVEESIKQRLLGYCTTSLLFSTAAIDPTIISWNRMALLHGPPGTGKTTICKALAQKVYVRNCDRYSGGVLLEVNSHSLFSKWFSESGKLVMKLFDHIHEIAEDEECFVAVLIDEVESITASRSNASRSNEPGDAVRVVNAVLTSLDALRRRPNVLVLCTSNMVDSIDPAFRDRVDLQIYLGPPPLRARYHILLSCINELLDRGIIRPRQTIGADYSQCVGGLGGEEVLLTAYGSGSGSGSGSGRGGGGYGDPMHTNTSTPEADGSLSPSPSQGEGYGYDWGQEVDEHQDTPERLLYIVANVCRGASGRGAYALKH
jgi:predicted DNA-binding ribbon-helix-helix protein